MDICRLNPKPREESKGGSGSKCRMVTSTSEVALGVDTMHDQKRMGNYAQTEPTQKGCELDRRMHQHSVNCLDFYLCFLQFFLENFLGGWSACWNFSCNFLLEICCWLRCMNLLCEEGLELGCAIIDYRGDFDLLRRKSKNLRFML